MSRLTTIAATLVVALAAFPAHAAPSVPDGLEPQVYCNAIGRLSESVAEARDNGTTREYMLAIVAAGITHPQALADARTTVLLAFSDPRLPPEREATLAFQVCWENYGE